MIAPPQKIIVVSDDNELEYQETTKANHAQKKEPMIVYKYTKSNTKKDSFLSVTEKQLTDLIRKEHIKPIP